MTPRPRPPVSVDDDLAQHVALAERVESVRPAAQDRLPVLEVVEREASVRQAIDALGEDDWAREQAAGSALTLEEAIELARTLAVPTTDTTSNRA